jgi:hypothetical protein
MLAVVAVEGIHRMAFLPEQAVQVVVGQVELTLLLQRQELQIQAVAAVVRAADRDPVVVEQTAVQVW